MDLAIIVLVTLNTAGLIVLLVGVFFKKNHTQEDKVYLQKENESLKNEIRELFFQANKTNQTDLYQFKDVIMQHMEGKLKEMNALVEKRLEGGFEKTNQTFVNVIERLSKIDEAQKNIEALSKEVVSLNTVLSDKKTRGIFGEVQLYQLLAAVLGETNSMYETQKKLDNDTIADAVIYAPEPLGMVAIDSKFPLDNYRRMIDKSLHEAERTASTKLFKADVKKHIDAISSKYIIQDVTSDQAIMFVPAEAIFAEITAYHDDVVQYANSKKVWMTSPTTLFSTLTMIQVIVKNIKRDQQTKVIISELNKLSDEFQRYGDRWDKLQRSIKSVANDADQMNITTGKIQKKFDLIKDARFEEAESIELNEENEV
jgi:DNA recombination protein RmuC